MEKNQKLISINEEQIMEELTPKIALSEKDQKTLNQVALMLGMNNAQKAEVSANHLRKQEIDTLKKIADEKIAEENLTEEQLDTLAQYAAEADFEWEQEFEQKNKEVANALSDFTPPTHAQNCSKCHGTGRIGFQQDPKSAYDADGNKLPRNQRPKGTSVPCPIYEREVQNAMSLHVQRKNYYEAVMNHVEELDYIGGEMIEHEDEEIRDTGALLLEESYIFMVEMIYGQ